MLRYICPRCKAAQEADPSQAGQVSACKRCGQSLRVPVQAPLAILLPDSQPAPTPSPPLPPPKGANRWGRLPWWLLVAGCVGVGAVLGLTVGGKQLRRQIPLVNRVQAKWDASETEARVRQFILDNADDPESVQFASWGPHDLTGELRRLTGQYIEARRPREDDGFSTTGPSWYDPAIRDSDYIVRVRFRTKNRLGALELLDTLCFLRNSEQGVAYIYPNPLGDQWLSRLREGLEEGIKKGPRQSLKVEIEQPRPPKRF